jgi:hypothetical protein
MESNLVPPWISFEGLWKSGKVEKWKGALKHGRIAGLIEDILYLRPGKKGRMVLLR